MRRLIAVALAAAAWLTAAPRRVLYVTHTAGYRHDSIPTSRQVLEGIAERSQGALEVVWTEDLTLLNAETLRGFDALFFFTSGELALSVQQKADLLEFVRSGKGFGGAHSATDTCYGWPAYGEMIGGVFDGHPWAREVAIRVEDAEDPMVSHLAPAFAISDEIYQFREFSRERVKVLLSLDTSSVDLNAEGVRRTDGDFALAWKRSYGEGRVFYTALGHPEGVWLDARFQKMLDAALRWLASAP